MYYLTETRMYLFDYAAIPLSLYSINQKVKWLITYSQRWPLVLLAQQSLLAHQDDEEDLHF